jgi:D-xylose transport system substrate-binding protein
MADKDVIAFLLPDKVSARWEQVDRPAFAAAVEANCMGCEVAYYNAGADEATQKEQLQQAISDGADVIVLAAVSTEASEDLIKEAGKLPVVAYDRFMAGADYYVSFDGAVAGKLQAEALVAAAGKSPEILMLNGAVDDPNAAELKQAAIQVFSTNHVRVLAEGNPKDWHTDTAKTWVAGQLDHLGSKRIDAVYAANDTQAEGVVQAFQDAHRPIPVITGMDGELAALQRIVTGTQTMTVYKSVPDQATQAAKIAVALLAGRPVRGTKDHEGVPSVIFQPVAVTLTNLTNTVVRDGVYEIGQICDAALVKRCQALGFL